MEEEIKQYDNIQNLTADYPAAVLLGSEYRHDMEVMHEELNKLGCEHLHIDPYIEYGLTKPHCFVSAERTDPIAKDAFDRMISFLNKKTEIKALSIRLQKREVRSQGGNLFRMLLRIYA